jgi:hypothetical protein
MLRKWPSCVLAGPIIVAAVAIFVMEPRKDIGVAAALYLVAGSFCARKNRASGVRLICATTRASVFRPPRAHASGHAARNAITVPTIPKEADLCRCGFEWWSH